MLKISPTSSFKKDLKKFKHQPKIIQKLQDVLQQLVHKKPLPQKLQDHSLGGNWRGSRECHVSPDILLIYRIDDKQNTLFLERFGSHSELF